MNSNLSSQDMVQSRLAPTQQSNGDNAKQAQQAQLMEAASQAAAANNPEAFNRLLQSASRQNAAHSSEEARIPNNRPGSGDPRAQADPMQRVRQALAAAMQQARQSGNPTNMNLTPQSAGGGINMPNPAAGQRTTAPFMPQRLDRFETFLGNFISALGEGMTIQQAAQSSLRDFRAERQRAMLLAEHAVRQQMALGQHAAQGAAPGGTPPQLALQQMLMQRQAQAGTSASALQDEKNPWKQLATDLMHHVRHTQATAQKGRADGTSVARTTGRQPETALRPKHS